jgi:hypothetical protein
LRISKPCHYKTSNITNETFESQEKNPFLIEMAGSPGSRGGFGKRTRSSAKSNSSRRFTDTLALTACHFEGNLEVKIPGK